MVTFLLESLPDAYLCLEWRIGLDAQTVKCISDMGAECYHAVSVSIVVYAPFGRTERHCR